MHKLKTYFERVPLEEVRVIVEIQRQEIAEQGHGAKMKRLDGDSLDANTVNGKDVNAGVSSAVIFHAEGGKVGLP